MQPLLLLDDLSDFAVLSLLALVQGLTEFLPISSSGHLVLAQHAMGLSEPEIALDIALHVGTLIAVVIAYRAHLLDILRRALGGDLREPGLIVLGTLPAAVVGLTFRDEVARHFHDPRFATGGLLATALILLVGESARRRGLRADAAAAAAGATPAEDTSRAVETRLTWKHALWIGCAQAVAIFPGISRSGSTIAAAFLCGGRAPEAARFSFLLSIPAILGAAVLSLPDALEQGRMGSPAMVVWATLFAGFVGWGALRMLLSFLGRGAFRWFAAYCALLSLGALLFA